MLFKPYNFSCRTLFPKLNILSFYSLFIFNSIVYVKTNLSNFTLTRQNSHKNLRMNLNLLLPRHRLEKVADSPLVLPIKLYNKLPLSVKQIESVTIFKNNIKKVLIKNAFYSIQGYLSCNATSLLM